MHTSCVNECVRTLDSVRTLAALRMDECAQVLPSAWRQHALDSAVQCVRVNHSHAYCTGKHLPGVGRTHTQAVILGALAVLLHL
jgi:hypothetical protein